MRSVRTGSGGGRGRRRSWRSVRPVAALTAAAVAVSCGGADAGTSRTTADPAPCEAGVELARAVMEGVGYVVAGLEVSVCRDGAAVVSVRPDTAVCTELGIECDRAWVFLEDSGEHDWWSVGHVQGRFDCEVSDAVASVCDRLGLESGRPPGGPSGP